MKPLVAKCQRNNGVRTWVGVKTPLDLDMLQKLYYLRKGDCFRILFAC